MMWTVSWGMGCMPNSTMLLHAFVHGARPWLEHAQWEISPLPKTYFSPQIFKNQFFPLFPDRWEEETPTINRCSQLKIGEDEWAMRGEAIYSQDLGTFGQSPCGVWKQRRLQVSLLLLFVLFCGEQLWFSLFFRPHCHPACEFWMNDRTSTFISD